MRRFFLELATEGGGHIVDLNPLIAQNADQLVGDGVLYLFVPGSTAAITTIEFEPGLVKHDMPRVFEHIAPDSAEYFHERTWHDDNGHAHVRAALVGPDLHVPFSNGKILTGSWQQVVLIDFDTRPRRRKIICSAMT